MKNPKDLAAETLGEIEENKRRITAAFEDLEIVQIHLSQEAYCKMSKFLKAISEHKMRLSRIRVTSLCGVPIIVDDSIPKDVAYLVSKKLVTTSSKTGKPSPASAGPQRDSVKRV